MRYKNKYFRNPARNSLLYFQIGLLAVTIFSYILIEFKFYIPEVDWKPKVAPTNVSFEERIPVTLPNNFPPPPDLIFAPNVIKIVDNNEQVNEVKIQSTESNQDLLVEATNLVIPAQNIIVVKEENEIEVPFAIIENVPVFPGCEKYSREQQRSCLQDKLMEHIRQHFKYPEEAKIANIQGRVVVTFIIDKEGILNVKFVRGPDRSLEDEALRIMSLVPKMTPGKQRGKSVSMRMSIPLLFKLDKSQ